MQKEKPKMTIGLSGSDKFRLSEKCRKYKIGIGDLIPVLLIAELNKFFLSESVIPICLEVAESVISEFDILENRN